MPRLDPNQRMPTLTKPKPEMRAATNRTKIIAAIREIPRGMVSTYGKVARAAGLPRGARQTAAALRSTVGLPWHRVLGSGGEIKTLGHDAFEQRFRLESEGVHFRGRRVDMEKHEYKFRRHKRA